MPITVFRIKAFSDLGVFESAAVLQVGGDAVGPEFVAA